MTGAGAAEGGSVSLSPAGASPLGYFKQDERGAGALAPLMLRGSGVLGALALWVWLLPGLPDLPAALPLVLLAAGIALPMAWGAAVVRGHGLGVLTEGGFLRGLVGGPGLRLVRAGLVGLVAAGALALRLIDGAAALWVLAALAMPVTWALMVWLEPRVAREAAGLHARRSVQFVARLVAVAIMLPAGAQLATIMPAPGPLLPTEGAGPLVGEVLGLARLWSGLEAYALGQAEEFGGWGRSVALAVVLTGQAASVWALASLAVALTLGRGEWARALGPASDALPGPAMGFFGPVVAAVMGLGVVAGAGVAGHWLAQVPTDERPSARIVVKVERLHEGYVLAGTLADLAELRRAHLAADAAALARAPEVLNAGFDAMIAQVDPFLNRYYSLLAEFLRRYAAVTGNLEGHLAAVVAQELLADSPFGPWEALLAESEAREQAEAALIASRRVDGLNPARLRVVAVDAGPALLPLAFNPGALRLRWTAAAGTWVIAARIAGWSVSRLAAQGVLTTVARLGSRLGGLLGAVAVEFLLLKLDEYLNRAEFRAEIVAVIEEQRRAALAALEARP